MIVDILKIEGMNCNHCVMAVKKELSKLNLKIIDVSIGSAQIEYDESKLPKEDISKAISEAGYRLV
ncbi:MAG: cation transporter [Ignavibacteriales bacterium]|nr:cation transporter [Ignavibacteriales bacterium]